MRLMAFMLAILSGPATASEIAVPSGKVLTLFDVIMEPEMARFRFTLPSIALGVEFVDLVDDLQYLCDDIAVPALVEAGREVPQLVISVSAAPVPFGEPTDVAQYFQPFRVAADACEWEEF